MGNPSDYKFSQKWMKVVVSAFIVFVTDWNKKTNGKVKNTAFLSCSFENFLMLASCAYVFEQITLLKNFHTLIKV